MAARGALEPRSSPVAVSVDSLGSNLNLDFTCFVFTFWFQTWDRMWDRIPTELRDRNGDRMRLTNRGPKPWTELCDRNCDRIGAELCDRNSTQLMSDVVRRVGRRIRRTCWATDSVSNPGRWGRVWVPLPRTPSRARVWGLCPARRAELRSGGSIPTRGAGSVSGSCAPRRWLRAVRSRLLREGRSMSVGPFVWRGKSCIRCGRSECATPLDRSR